MPPRPVLPSFSVSDIPQEEYADTAGFLAHGASPPIKALLEKKDLTTEMVLQYSEDAP
ncbi:hypothetical protein C8R43DRAFT_1135533 [Mycena crocata]|nr:hypothetical protein C8R43DRAFT_1135533 [Mycena crocata]